MLFLREAIEHAIGSRELAWKVDSAAGLADFKATLSRTAPEIIVTQASFSDGDAARLLQLLRSRQASTQVIVIGLDDASEEHFLPALELGARGFIDRTTSTSELIDCILGVARGEMHIGRRLATRLAEAYRQAAPARPRNSGLTDRELQVLTLLAHGYTNKEIASRVMLSEHTVRAHLRNVMQKLSVENRVQAVARATRQGLLPHLLDAEGDASSLTPSQTA
jgi:DNA-binding NarL/FixJ family response regulator